MSTPNLNLPNMPQNSLQPSVPYNEAMQILDALVGLAFQAIATTAPPTTVAGDAGKCWLIPTGATGAWVGKTDQIALCTGANLWAYIVPKVGLHGYSIVDDKDMRYKSTGWVLLT